MHQLLDVCNNKVCLFLLQPEKSGFLFQIKTENETMKKEKFFKITYNGEVFYCHNISAVIDLITGKKWPIKPYQLWKATKEIGDRHTIGNMELSVLPMLYHTNPNKGGYRERKDDSRDRNA